MIRWTNNQASVPLDERLSYIARTMYELGNEPPEGFRNRAARARSFLNELGLYPRNCISAPFIAILGTHEQTIAQLNATIAGRNGHGHAVGYHVGETHILFIFIR